MPAHPRWWTCNASRPERLRTFRSGGYAAREALVDAHQRRYPDLDDRRDGSRRGRRASLRDAWAGLVVFGSPGYGPLYWIGLGMTIYGLLYFIVHDGLVHQRWPFRYIPRAGYLKRLVQAHRLHHAVDERESGVSFGFLYAPPVRHLRDTLKARRESGTLGRTETSAE